MENCPGWGNIWTPWEPELEINLIYENPLFVNFDDLNFNYLSLSPCIDAGNPIEFDLDGTIRDIGANFQPILEGDCNLDYEQNIIDVIYNLNNCIFEELLNSCQCSDLNGDYELNVLDIVILVNIILSN